MYTYFVMQSITHTQRSMQFCGSMYIVYRYIDCGRESKTARHTHRGERRGVEEMGGGGGGGGGRERKKSEEREGRGREREREQEKKGEGGEEDRRGEREKGGRREKHTI